MAGRVSKTTRGERNTTRTRVVSKAATRQAARPPVRAKTRAELGITEEQVRSRAYQIFLRRNGAPGDPFGDWVLAERELISEGRS